MNQIDTDTYSVERQGLGGCDDRVAQKVDGVWHNAIGLESTETHRHIALDWQKQCIPFPTIRDSVMEEAKGKQDILIPESQVRLRGNLTLPDGTPMTDHALGALAQFAGMPPKVLSYLRDHDDKELAKFLNTDLDQREIDWAKVRRLPATISFGTEWRRSTTMARSLSARSPATSEAAGMVSWTTPMS